MKTRPKTFGKPPGSAAFANAFCQRLAPDQILRNSGEWATDAAIERLLDLLFQCPSKASSLRDLTDFRFAMPADLGATLDDLIAASAEMRGLIFRACARRINELMLEAGAGPLVLPRPAITRRLN